MLPVPVLGLTGVLEVMSMTWIKRVTDQPNGVSEYIMCTQATPDVVINLFIAISM